VFLGEYQHSLDAKGRVILPSKFRARLETGCVLTKGQDRCLTVYPREEFDRKVARLSEARSSSSQVRDFNRMFFSGASDDGPDKQGRLSIPEPLRSYASLDREITIIGVGGHVEIWDRAGWEQRLGNTEQSYAELSEATEELPF
jgi:MraZ protein